MRGMPRSSTHKGTHSPGSSTPPAPLLPARPNPISSLVLGLFFQGGDQGANSKPSCLVNVLDHSRPRSEIKALCYSILSDEVFSSFSSVIVIVTTAAARGFIRTIMRKAHMYIRIRILGFNTILEYWRSWKARPITKIDKEHLA
ncbi:hypothetical protein NOF04DRAFT_19167 [Fusarium oxysporum II5]|uniref:Uncharacterized protein n=1 Tax=Fusarium odoratissimum (strain NRRL 54006) TaxID=1089451 RepID=X0JVF4_FUSO5|nr:uncharacterized protein FOIG_05210 [Fusarium odoratissimum NRRL 54006]EXM05208.1 hypothetical protein FOIG_05210 [Fusarium odoratissimum NRRL 54006]KAK2127060.1 hypothetical protein NOF04DRAFT_19167 [Fusarium oxysporum II5]